jgi:hypothetical protein
MSSYEHPVFTHKRVIGDAYAMSSPDEPAILLNVAVETLAVAIERLGASGVLLHQQLQVIEKIVKRLILSFGKLPGPRGVPCDVVPRLSCWSSAFRVWPGPGMLGNL